MTGIVAGETFWEAEFPLVRRPPSGGWLTMSDAMAVVHLGREFSGPLATTHCGVTITARRVGSVVLRVPGAGLVPRFLVRVDRLCCRCRDVAWAAATRATA